MTCGFADLAESLSQTEVGAGALRAGIRYEALLRDQHRWYQRAVTMATGLRTEQQRRERRERWQRHRLAPERRVGGSDAPVVFWHGPDCVDGHDRPLVVLVNGWTASGLLWPADLVKQLEDRCDVVRIDNRGSGYSRTAPAPFTIAQLANDVAGVLRAIGARSATVVGLSMGGMIAQETAMRHPELVARLVLCGTRPPAPVGFLPARSVVAASMSPPRPDEPLREYFERSWSAVVGPGYTARRPDWMRELVDRSVERPTPRAGVIAQLRAITSWSGAGRLTQIAVPTIVLHGAEDPLSPVGNGMRLAQLIPDAEYVELPAVGHLVPFEAPEALLAAVFST